MRMSVGSLTYFFMHASIQCLYIIHLHLSSLTGSSQLWRRNRTHMSTTLALDSLVRRFTVDIFGFARLSFTDRYIRLLTTL